MSKDLETVECLEARLVELDLLEQALNEGVSIDTFKMKRLDDIKSRIDAIEVDRTRPVASSGPKAAIQADADKQASRIEKAYGGCHNCYGKGYATTNETWTTRDVVGGEAFAMNFCSCPRGEQLKAIVTQLTKAKEGAN